MILITLDIDWAPDFIIKKVDEILKEKGVKATWFVTHNSAYLNNLAKNKNYELGIHPNFLPNTTQGKTPKEILKKLKKIVPNSVSLRTHSLHQNAHLLSLYKNYGIKLNLTIFLFLDYIEYHIFGKMMLKRMKKNQIGVLKVQNIFKVLKSIIFIQFILY